MSSTRKSDHEWVGIRIYSKKPHVARIWSQNLNVIQRNDSFTSFAETLLSMNRYDVQYFAFSETNLNFTNAYIRDSLDATTQLVMSSSRMTISSVRTAHSSELHQCGGNMSISHGLLSARYASSGCDKYGRFHWQEFFGQKSQLKIYNIYNPVVHEDDTERDGAVWVQHRLALQKDGIDAKPMQHLFDTLVDMITEGIMKERQVIVLGDFNLSVFDTKMKDISPRMVMRGHGSGVGPLLMVHGARP